MLCSRRGFLGTSGAAAAGLLAARASADTRPQLLLKPRRLRRGDTVGLINPVRYCPDAGAVEAATRSLQALGLRVTCAQSPPWRGAMIGHVDRQLTLPIGLPVEVDAGRRTIRLLEPAVV